MSKQSPNMEGLFLELLIESEATFLQICLRTWLPSGHFSKITTNKVELNSFNKKIIHVILGLQHSIIDLFYFLEANWMSKCQYTVQCIMGIVLDFKQRHYMCMARNNTLPANFPLIFLKGESIYRVKCWANSYSQLYSYPSS